MNKSFIFSLVILIFLTFSCTNNTNTDPSTNPTRDIVGLEITAFTVNDSASDLSISNTGATSFMVSFTNTSLSRDISDVVVSFYQSSDSDISTSADTLLTNAKFVSLLARTNLTVVTNITFDDIANQVHFGACVSATGIESECSDSVQVNFNNGTRNSSLDFDVSEVSDVYDIWSDGTTMWVVDGPDGSPGKLYAYNFVSKTNEPGKNFDTINNRSRGVWSDGTTMWVSDYDDSKLYAYSLTFKTNQPGKDFNTLSPAGNGNPQGIWSDGTTMWVANLFSASKIHGYNLSTKAHQPNQDFNTLLGNPVGMWSDGTTMWVIYRDNGTIYGYDLASKSRDTTKDFSTPSSAGNDAPQGIWSDGTTMWVSDYDDSKLYAYNLKK